MIIEDTEITAEKMREIRGEMGMIQRVMAKELGLSEKAYQHYEQRGAPKLRMVAATKTIFHEKGTAVIDDGTVEAYRAYKRLRKFVLVAYYAFTPAAVLAIVMLILQSFGIHPFGPEDTDLFRRIMSVLAVTCIVAHFSVVDKYERAIDRIEADSAVKTKGIPSAD